MNAFPAGSPSSFVETLAHVAAPSRACDDANYLSHAAACLDFRPVTRLRVVDCQSQDNEDDEEEYQQQSPGFSQKKRKVGSSQRDSSPPHAEISLLSSFPDESALLRSDRPSRPPPPVPATHCDHDQQHQQEHQQSGTGSTSRGVVVHGGNDELSSSFHTPPSTVPDSQPPILTPGIDIERNTTPDNNNINNINNNGRRIQFPTVLDHPETETPASTSASPSKKRHRDEEAPDPHDSSPSSFPRPQPQPQPHNPVHPAAAPLTTTAPDPDLLLSDSGGGDYLPLPLQIHPPPPAPSSTASFTTHITPTLRKLATQLRLERVFRPAARMRKLRTLERGFWILNVWVRKAAATDDKDIDKDNNDNDNDGNDGNEDEGADEVWPAPFFARFWSSLSAVIGTRGLAGWGVWCHCEETETAAADPRPPHNLDAVHNGDVADTSSYYPLTIRVYTWGETAAHVYLLLYLASEKRIKRLRGVEWRDGKGEAVIQMS